MRRCGVYIPRLQDYITIGNCTSLALLAFSFSSLPFLYLLCILLPSNPKVFRNAINWAPCLCSTSHVQLSHFIVTLSEPWLWAYLFGGLTALISQYSVKLDTVASCIPQKNHGIIASIYLCTFYQSLNSMNRIRSRYCFLVALVDSGANIDWFN